MDLAWFSKEGLEEFYRARYGEDGALKPDTAPIAQGSFACIYSAADLGGPETGVLRVVSALAGVAGDFCFEKEVQAVKAFLKLMGEPDTPVEGEVVLLDQAKQPPGFCPIYCYLIDRGGGGGIRRIFTVMPLAKPLMDVVADQLEAASSQAEGDAAKRDLADSVRWMSQIATALKYMHTKGVFWRDCKLDNIVLVGDDAKIIDISSGVCTVGYASHEQLIKLPVQSYADSQKITDALEQVLLDQPDHNTWATQDVFALSIVVIELLTYGMFTYPYKKDEAAPSYAHLLLFELEVYNLLLHELSSVYDVSVLKGRLDRKIKHWEKLIPDKIDATSQEVRDDTLWPLAVSEFCRDKRLFDLWAALAFWDHVDHQFGFISHWTEWYFDFDTHAAAKNAAALPEPAVVEEEPAKQRQEGEEAPAGEGEGEAVAAPKVPMAVWRQRADDLSADVSAIKQRLAERSERIDHFEDDHTARVVKRLSSLTQRMDVLNNSLSSFWGANSSPAKGAGLPSVRIVYSTADRVSKVIEERKDKFITGGGGAQGSRLIEVRLRLKAQEPEKRAELMAALGRAAESTPMKGGAASTPSR